MGNGKYQRIPEGEYKKPTQKLSTGVGFELRQLALALARYWGVHYVPDKIEPLILRAHGSIMYMSEEWGMRIRGKHNDVDLPAWRRKQLEDEVYNADD